METIIAARKKTKPAYPYIGKHIDGSIVLFTEPDTGQGLNFDYQYKKNWCEQNFRAFAGEVILSN